MTAPHKIQVSAGRFCTLPQCQYSAPPGKKETHSLDLVTTDRLYTYKQIDEERSGGTPFPAKAPPARAEMPQNAIYIDKKAQYALDIGTIPRFII